MSQYTMEDLVKLWATEQLTTEQAIGQLLLQVKSILKRLAELERNQRRLPNVDAEGN